MSSWFFIPLQVLLRTLQSTNSTRYRHLIEELFTQDQEGSRVSEFAYFVDPQDAKRVSQKVRAEGGGVVGEGVVGGGVVGRGYAAWNSLRH